MSRRPGGYTLVEVVVASFLASVVAGGTMMAFVTAARMTQRQGDVRFAEASGLAQQTVEKFRNYVEAGQPWLTSKAPLGWCLDQLPSSVVAGTESILKMSARRCYRVTPEDCDGVGGPGDCYALQVAVCWKDLSTCPAPACAACP